VRLCGCGLRRSTPTAAAVALLQQAAAVVFYADQVSRCSCCCRGLMHITACITMHNSSSDQQNEPQ
jgi:hypothetical protein